MRNPRRFIVVDDDPMNNMICKHAIGRFDSGAEILLFTEPEKALVMIEESYGNETYGMETVLFLDINMPTMSGWEFLEVFKDFKGSMHQDIDIYILSSSIDQSDKEKAGNSEFVKGYLPKPLNLQTIHEIMES